MDELKESAQVFADAKLVPTIHFHHIHDDTINNYYSVGEKPKTSKQEYDTVTRKRGRPKATEKSLAHYACEGADAEKLKDEITQRLMQIMGTADEIAKLEQELINERKIKAAIPFKLLKEEFGDMVKCARQVLNRSENTLNLR